MNETNELKNMQLKLARLSTLFRQNVGLGWIGKSVRFVRGQMIRVNPGDVLIREARPLHAGLVKGSSDLIGWTPVLITQEHVGRTLAVFTAVEGKKGRNGTTTEQGNFIGQVNASGGIAFVARSDVEALATLQQRIAA